MKNSKLLVLAAVLAVAGCAEMRMGMKTMPNVSCTAGGTCNVDVAVTRISTPPGCTVDVADHVGVAMANAGGNTIIKWQLTSDTDNNFKFVRQYGIAFDKPPPATKPPANVMDPNGQGGGRSVTITDNHNSNNSKGSWPYTVYVTDGSISCQKDPWVDNN